MQVKKYRAATTREALEQVKQELGEEAFVLETKRVHSKGFLGFGGSEQIEVSAASPSAAVKTIAEPKTNNAKQSPLGLSLLDDAPASPSASANQENLDKSGVLKALKDRAASGAGFSTAQRNASSAPSNRLKADQRVEISSAEPKIIHPRREMKEFPKQSMLETKTVAVANTNETATTVSNRDFEMLRAEMREIKFTLNSIAGRHSFPVWKKPAEFQQIDEVFDSPFYEAFLELASTGVGKELAQKIISDIIPQYKANRIDSELLLETALLKALSSGVKFGQDPLQNDGQSILAIIGSTGVGKTTTVAKIAARAALHEKRRVELVTIDTYRIAAVEQLKTYAEIIGAGCHVVRSVFELDAVLRRLPLDATILIDTTGKSSQDLADQYELADYLRGRKDIRKCLAVQATMNLDDAVASIKRFAVYGADCLALTKMDETIRKGAMIDLAIRSKLSLAYLCFGQRVPEDLQLATPNNFIAKTLHSLPQQ